MENIEWNRYFDKIYCIHMVEMEEREEPLKEELKRVGIDENASYFSWKLTFKNPMYKYIYNNKEFPQLKASYFKVSFKNCTMAHYEILKEAQIKGYKRILVLEDDVKFLKSTKLIKDILNMMPSEDIILFDKWTFKKDEHARLLKDERVNSAYATYHNDFLSAACYSLNQDGISSIINVLENKFIPMDFAINDKYNPNPSKCFSVINLAIQKQYKDDKSDIEYKKNAYDKIIIEDLYK